MGYALKRADRSSGAAVRRIADELLSRSIALAEGPPEPALSRVHEIRKRLKKARALLRLVRPGFPGYAAENAALRDTGRMISQARDAEVLVATLAALAEGAGRGDQAALRRAAAVIGPGAETADALPGALAPALRGIRKRAADWKTGHGGFRAFRPGIEDALAAAARAQVRALKAPGDEAVHEWRKRVKDHWYHARLLSAIWPEAMAPRIAAAGALGEMLGEAQDLAVLSARIVGTPLAPDDRATILRLAAARAENIRARSRMLGRRLFAEPPGHVADRWEGWWAIWRKQDG